MQIFEHKHFKTYKPFGYLSQFTSNEQRQIRKKRFLKDFVPYFKGLMPIGRLDEKSEGLLLLTTDGKLSNYVNSANIEKEYVVQLDGIITQNALKWMKDGVTIGLFGSFYLTKPCKAVQIETPDFLPLPNAKLRIGVHRPTSWVRVVINEGKYKQIRKMTAAVGYPTIRLIRVRVGTLYLGTLTEGTIESISDAKIQHFYAV